MEARAKNFDTVKERSCRTKKQDTRYRLLKNLTSDTLYVFCFVQQPHFYFTSILGIASVIQAQPKSFSPFPLSFLFLLP